MIEDSIKARLFELQDLKYREFHSKLIPTIDINTIIGVRTPELRMFGKELAKTPEAMSFIKDLPHKYYDENNLHVFLIENIKDYNTVIKMIDEILPYVDNWATCDLICPEILKKHLPELIAKIMEWINSEKTYTIRFGVGMLMRFYLDEKFKTEYLECVANIKSEEYYVNMMRAWYFATALAKQYDTTLTYMEKYRLDKWTHNKSIQKSIESHRITDEQKSLLRTLKRI